MDKRLQKRLARLPQKPGVYFFKDSSGEIIYVGKAANLRSRAKSYFQAGRPKDTKTTLLVNDIAQVDWRPTETEPDALFLEAEMVRRYMPRYNILLRDDKSNLFVRVDLNSELPTVRLVRRPLPDGAKYIGPFINGVALREVLRFLRRAFPYATKPSSAKRVSLEYHIGLDPGLEEGKTNLKDYRANLRKLVQYLRGGRVTIVRQMEKDMKIYSRAKDFEKAARTRDQLRALQNLGRQTLLSQAELAEASLDHALDELRKLLGLPAPPSRIEGFDISHIQGSDNTASMVVFTHGLPDKSNYRKFKLRTPGNDDFAHIYETVFRRLKPGNAEAWSLPQLVVIDGGKGQLAAAIRARDDTGQNHLPMIGLAKQEETIFVHGLSLPNQSFEKLSVAAEKLKAYHRLSGEFMEIILPTSAPSLKLLQRIRDESHRFALSYHGSLRQRRSLASDLEKLPGIGPATRKKLVKQFGSLRAAGVAKNTDIIKLFGPSRGLKIYEQLRSLKL